MTVKMLLQNIDSAELSEWIAFLNLEHYEKKFKDEAMTADERSEAILKTIFGDPKPWQKQSAR